MKLFKVSDVRHEYLLWAETAIGALAYFRTELSKGFFDYKVYEIDIDPKNKILGLAPKKLVFTEIGLEDD